MNGLAGSLTRTDSPGARRGTRPEEPSRHTPRGARRHTHPSISAQTPIRHSPRLRRRNLDPLDRPVRCCAHPYRTTTHRELSEIPAAERGYDEPSEQIRARFPYGSEASANNSPTTPLTSDPSASPRSSRMRMPLTLPRSRGPLARLFHLPLENRKHVSVGEFAVRLVDLRILDRGLEHMSLGMRDRSPRPNPSYRPRYVNQKTKAGRAWSREATFLSPRSRHTHPSFPRLRRGNLDPLDRPVRCCAHPYRTTAHRELSEIPAAERGYDEPSEQIRARFPYESEASANNSPTTPLTSDPPASPRSSRMRMPITSPRSPEPLARLFHLPLENRKHVSVGEFAATSM